jgi:hypothetical protein
MKFLLKGGLVICDSACGVGYGVIGTWVRGGVFSVLWSGQDGGNGVMMNCSFSSKLLA